MKLGLTSFGLRIERIKIAFANKEDSQQISARMAKLFSETTQGKVTPSVVLAKSISLYLRRQQHLYGDKAYERSLNEIVAFLDETGNLEGQFSSYLIAQKSDNNIDDPNFISSIYSDEGAYGLICLIEKDSHFKSRAQKAGKLLEFGKVLKTAFNEIGIRSQMATLALALDKSESTYRGACWSMLSDNNAQQALDLFAYLYFYYQDYSPQDTTLIEPLSEKIKVYFGEEYIQEYLEKNQDIYKDRKKHNIIQEYRKRLILKNKHEQEAILLELLEKIEVDGVIEFINSNERYDNKTKSILALRAAQAIRNLPEPNIYKNVTERLADYALSKDKSEGTIRNAYFAYQRIHNFRKSAELLILLKALAGDNPTQRQRNLLWSSPEHLITLIDQLPEFNTQSSYDPLKGKICYVIHNSLPYSSGGYATRGHGLLAGLLDQDIDIYALTRPGYPHDISTISVKDVPEQDNIDGVIYKRLYSPSRRDYSKYEYILNSVKSYKQAFLADRPELIISASNHLDGLPAMFAARELGIPFIYEIRGFWEVTRLSKYPEFAQDPMFEVEKKLESLTANHADYIFTLTQGMIDELNHRGVKTEDKVTLLPNSCDVTRFNPQSKDPTLASELNIPLTVPVIGYVGTLVSYEGLDDLATACGRLKEKGYEFRLLIVGNENATGSDKGGIVNQVTQIATENYFNDWLIMPGRVPFEDVERYYSLIDIAPFPRKAWPVCEMVPPMKTLEALSMKKAVLVSSNKALTEMITHDVNGRIFERGNVDDLVLQLQYMFDHPEKWSAYGEAGREFVEQERTWERTAEKAAKVIRHFSQYYS